MSVLQSLLGPEHKTIVADGGYATALYDAGFYIHRSFAELSLTHPEAVTKIAQSYKDSGAQLLHTNTFGATHYKLKPYNIESKLEEIIQASCEIARQVAQNDCAVVGTMAPTGAVMEPLGPMSKEEAYELFLQSAKVFEQQEIDAIALYAFHDLKEAEQAICAVQAVSKKPLFLYVAIQDDLKTSYGHKLSEVCQLAEKYEVAALGISGEVGPSGAFSALEKLLTLTHLPLIMLPAAGLPRFVNNEYIYLCNPDYLAKYAKRMATLGARVVGGSSGVHAPHVQAVAQSIRMLQPSSLVAIPQKVERLLEQSQSAAGAPIALELRSKLGQCLVQKRCVVSVELNPPKGANAEGFFKQCQELEKANIPFVNIPDGARAMARMSSLQVATYLSRHTQLESIPHLTARDRNLIGLQSDLLGAYVNNVRNVLLVTGDPPKLGDCPDATAVYDVDAIGMTHIACRMNRGLDLGGSSFGRPTQFCVGVAVNPTAMNQELEKSRFIYKVEAGADFAMTQPVYDVEAFESFFESIGGQKIPIIVGIWPLVSLRNAEFLKNEVPGVNIPDWIIEKFETVATDTERSLELGKDIAVQTISKLKGKVAGFQISAPFNRAQVAIEVIQRSQLL